MEMKINLRALEPTDLEQLYQWENEERSWFVSAATRPLSKDLLKHYIASANDIYTDKQVRLMIETPKTTVGCIDLFDFDPLHQRAGVGILIDEQHTGNGYAYHALEALKHYAFNQLGLHQLFAEITDDNTQSIALFQKAGFVITGTRNQWIKKGRTWHHQHTLQCFSH